VGGGRGFWVVLRGGGRGRGREEEEEGFCGRRPSPFASLLFSLPANTSFVRERTSNGLGESSRPEKKKFCTAISGRRLKQGRGLEERVKDLAATVEKKRGSSFVFPRVGFHDR